MKKYKHMDFPVKAYQFAGLDIFIPKRVEKRVGFMNGNWWFRANKDCCLRVKEGDWIIKEGKEWYIMTDKAFNSGL